VKARKWPERLTWAALVVAFLVPVWLFRYVPTQDGPAHLGNAIVLRDYGAALTRHQEFFEVSLEPFPNWTSHLFLTILARVVPPLVAEKLLVTVYLIGFTLACRYFLASWPGAALPLAPLCLLFVYNRCFFMGFYNYCLSLPLLFLILGLCARLPERLSAASMSALAGLFLLAYFTHLAGYVQAVLGALVLAVALPGQRWSRLLTVAVALLPSAAFVVDYLTSSGLSVTLVADAIVRRLTGPSAGTGFAFPLGRDLFIPYQGWSFPVQTCALSVYGALALTGLWLCCQSNAGLRGWLAVLTLAGVMTVVYLVGPANLGQHGGYLKARFAIVLPVLCLPLLRLPPVRWLRYPLLAGVYALLVLQLIATCSHFAAANRVLDRYTAGVEQAGGGHVLYVVQSKHQEPYEVSYLLHASHYYCLQFGKTNLDDYEATAHYFPVRFRPGVVRGRGERNDFAYYPQRAAVDQILAWEWPGRAGPPPSGFREVYRSGSLAIYERANLPGSKISE
jgi:hypothetical protein